MARLIVVSNRVAVPSRDGGNLAGGLAVAVRSLLKRHEGLWFGWSGTVSRDEDIATKTVQHGGMSYAVTDLAEADYQEYYNGFANRVLWPAVATSIAHALSMTLEERRTRHRALFQVISDNDLKSWGEHFLVALTNDAASPLRHEQLGVTPPLRSNVA